MKYVSFVFVHQKLLEEEKYAKKILIICNLKNSRIYNKMLLLRYNVLQTKAFLVVYDIAINNIAMDKVHT